MQRAVLATTSIKMHAMYAQRNGLTLKHSSRKEVRNYEAKTQMKK
jgi:hypothetical protein